MPKQEIEISNTFSIMVDYDYTPGTSGDRNAPAGDSYPEPHDLQIKWIDPDDKEEMYAEGYTEEDLEEAIIRFEEE